MKRRIHSLELYTFVTPFLYATQTACSTSEVEMKCMYTFSSRSRQEWKRTLVRIEDAGGELSYLIFGQQTKELVVKFTVGIGFRVEVVT